MNSRTSVAIANRRQGVEQGHLVAEKLGIHLQVIERGSAITQVECKSVPSKISSWCISSATTHPFLGALSELLWLLYAVLVLLIGLIVSGMVLALSHGSRPEPAATEACERRDSEATEAQDVLQSG